MSTTTRQNDEMAGCIQAFMGVEFRELGRSLALCRLPLPARATQRVQGPEPADTPSRRWRATGHCGGTESLQRMLAHADIWRLRSMLAHEEAFVCRLNDYRVRVAVAHLIERGVLGLFECVDSVEVIGAATAPRSEAVRRERPAATPSASAGAPSVARPSPAPSVAPARVIEPIEAVDAAMQAAVLVAASRAGTPFCEECVRRAAARGQAVAA